MKETQTKEHITRNTVEQALWRTNTAEIKGTAFSLSYCFLFSLVIALVLLFAVRQAHLPFIFQILSFLIPFIPTIAILRLGYTVFAERKLLQEGSFDIITSSLYYKDEKLIRRYKQHDLVKYFYFESYPPCEVGKTEYQLASAGDTYYLVLYRTKKPYVKLFYAAKMYDLRTT